jgi:hypothetical protein
MNKRRQLLIDTIKFKRQLEKRFYNSGVTGRGLKILEAIMEINGPSTREMIAEVNGYSAGGVSTNETNYLLRDDLITKEETIMKRKGSARGRFEFELTDKGFALLDYILTGKKVECKQTA